MNLGGNLPPGHDALLFSIRGTGSFICPVHRHGWTILVLHSYKESVGDMIRRSVTRGDNEYMILSNINLMITAKPTARRM